MMELVRVQRKEKQFKIVPILSELQSFTQKLEIIANVS